MGCVCDEKAYFYLVLCFPLSLRVAQVLGETLDKIAWEKGGIFKAGCRAFTVEQPSGGMSVLRQVGEGMSQRVCT